MLYLGIDQQKRQLTVNLRSEDGSVILKRQVSTEREKVRTFFADLAFFLLPSLRLHAFALEFRPPAPRGGRYS